MLLSKILKKSDTSELFLIYIDKNISQNLMLFCINTIKFKNKLKKILKPYILPMLHLQHILFNWKMKYYANNFK